MDWCLFSIKHPLADSSFCVLKSFVWNGKKMHKYTIAKEWNNQDPLQHAQDPFTAKCEVQRISVTSWKFEATIIDREQGGMFYLGGFLSQVEF